MPKTFKISARRPSVKSQIERTSKITVLEQLWGKNPRKSLKVISRRRGIGGVDLDALKGRAYRTHVHNHIVRGDGIGSALPSSQDLESAILHGKTNAIVSVNKQGKAIGYTVIRFIKIPKGHGGDSDFFLSRQAFAAIAVPKMVHKLTRVYPNGLSAAIACLKDYGLQIRFMPLSGYEFDKQRAVFVLKQERKTK